MRKQYSRARLLANAAWPGYGLLLGLGLAGTGAAQAQSLTVSSRAPSRNKINVARTVAPAITFSQAPAAATAGSVRVFSAQRGGQLVRGGNATVSGNTLTVTPATSFRPGETVQVTVPATVLDGSGNAATPEVYQFTAAAGAAPGTFFTASTATVGGSPNTVLAGDIDGDGYLDLLTANQGGNTVSVARNTGTGSFGTATSLPAGTGPRSLALGDLNNDGALDFIVVNGASSGASVSVYLNNGTSTSFNSTANSTVAAGTGVRGVILGDVDADGDLDLLTTTTRTTVGAYLSLNNGSGGFGTATSIPIASSPRSLVLGDVDNDGDLDLLTTSSGSNNVSICLNGGSGSYGTPTTVAVGTTPLNLTLGDIDGDGDLDLLVANSGSNDVSVCLNNGSGSYGAATSVGMGTGAGTAGVALGDVDGDGDLDLLASNQGTNTVGVSLNNGSGGFGAPSAVAVGAYPSNLALADVDNDGDLDIVTANYNGSSVSVALNGPVLSSLTPATGSAGTSVVLTGLGLAGATGVRFNGTAATVFTVNSATSITVTVPAGATTGNVTVTAPSGTSNGLAFTVLADLTVSTGTAASPTAVPAGAYNTITITGTGYAQLAGATVVAGGVSVQAGGSLDTNCQALTGTGSFTLAAGGTLLVCDANGLSSTIATGAVQLTGTRSFSTDASYVYNGTAAQATGNQLPAQVRGLSTTNANALTLTSATSVAQVLTVGAAGNLVTGGNALTLLSGSAGTALAVNSGTGVVSGAATVQRYLDPSLNSGPGYRHYSAPVSNTTVADLATSGYAPTVNSAYNTSATPGTTTPFPTVFGYDQSRLASATSNLSAFDKGFFSPAATTDALVVGRGYAVNIAASQLVDFVGTLNTGPTTLSLDRTSGSAAADGGWQLVGNPYPAPLDWSQVAAADRAGLDAAIYVVQSSGQYTGTYRSYVNGQSTSGTNNPLIGAGQGFFVRVSSGSTAGALTFRDAQRVTTFASQATVYRTAADSRPVLRLSLSPSASPASADNLVLYAQAGATAGFDGAFDAGKLPNPTGLNLSALTAAGESLAIDGRPAFAAGLVVPLAVGVPAAGSYQLALADVANLPAGLVPTLTDAQTGQTLALSAGTTYAFSATASQAAALLTGRFSLGFRLASTLAAAAALAPEAVTVYPNPATERCTVALPGVSGASTVQAELRNSLGQVVRRQSAALPAAGTSLTLETTGLAPGVYVLRLQAGAASLAKRLSIQ